LSQKSGQAHPIAGLSNLKSAIIRLTYDLAVLEANYAIERGLRGQEAMQGFGDAEAGLLKEVTESWQTSCKRLKVESVDETEGTKRVAQAFRRVQDDLGRLLRGLSPTAPQPETESTDTEIAGERRESRSAHESRRTESEPEAAPSSTTSQRVRIRAQRRGRHPNQERRAAICKAIGKHGNQWRDHLGEIFAELDSLEVSLGDCQSLKIDLDEGDSYTVSRWDDLDLSQGKQRSRIIDTLRKYR